jgi:uncharacterized protein (DUF58 family)
MKTFSAAVDVLSRLPHLSWRQPQAAALGRGMHDRRFPGVGDHFWQFRPYVTGDSSRNVDWKQTARRDALFVREHQKQSLARFQIWQDCSPSMDYCSGGRLISKKDYAETLLLVLSMFFLDMGEKVSWAGSDAQFVGGAEGVSRLLPRLKTMDKSMPKWTEGALPVAISDFYFPIPGVQAAVKQVSGGLAVQIYDPAEADWPFEGRVLFVDPESPDAEARVFDDAADIGPVMREKFLSHRQALGDAVGAAGWSLLSFSTAEPLTGVTLEILNRLSHG